MWSVTATMSSLPLVQTVNFQTLFSSSSQTQKPFILHAYQFVSESDTELGLAVVERRKHRRKSVAPMHPGLQTWVETKELTVTQHDGRRASSSGLAVQIGKKPKATYEELRELVNAGKIKEIKINVRENDWDLKEEIRSRLWPLLDSIHESNKSSLDGFYYDTATQLYGSEQGQFVGKNPVLNVILKEKHVFNY